MIEKLKDIAFKGSKIAVIGVQFSSNEVDYTYMLCQKEKQQLRVIEKEQGLDAETLFEKVPTKTPVFLCFMGKGVLNKKVKDEVGYRDSVIFNASEEDFYFYEVKQEEDLYISMARRDQVDAVIEQFSEKKYSVVDLTIGPFIAVSLAPLFEKEHRLVAGNTVVSLDEGTIVGFESVKDEEQRTVIGDEVLNAAHAPLFAASLHHFFPNPAIQFEYDVLQEEVKEYRFKRGFELLGAITLIGFFAALLISYLMLNKYNEDALILENQIYQSEESYLQIQALVAEKANKEDVLRTTGFFNEKFISFLVQEVSMSIPSEMRLKKLEVFPLGNKIKDGELIAFDSKRIDIEGITTSNVAFNRWIKQMNRKDWVSKVDKIDLSSNRRSNTFKVQIFIK